MWKEKYPGSPFYLRRETPGWLEAGLFVVPRCQPRRHPLQQAAESPKPVTFRPSRCKLSPLPAAQTKRNLVFVLAGRPLLTGNSCLWKRRVKCGGLTQPELENGVFSSRSKAKPLRGVGAHGCWEGGNPWRCFLPRQKPDWHREAPLP